MVSMLRKISTLLHMTGDVLDMIATLLEWGEEEEA